MTFPQPHPSLPARPQSTVSGSFKPAFTAPTTAPTLSASGAPGTKSFYSGGATTSSAPGTSFTAFKPRSVVSNNQDWRASSSSSIAAAPVSHPTLPPGYSNGIYPTSQPQPQTQYLYQQQSYYAPSAETFAQNTPPPIRNPFPAPAQGFSAGNNGVQDRIGSTGYDPEREAQIAQWQSTYMNKEDATASKGAQSSSSIVGPRPATATSSNIHDNAFKAKGDSKQKTVVRSGGGQEWQDSTLLEWDPAHYRLFVGNLAGEVTDESLLKAFAKYDSVQKARVVRDKRSTKSKGYGFVSFSDGDEFFKAAKEMQGKYIGSHPVILRRSTTEVKPVVPTDKNKKGKDHKEKGPAGHANTGAGVQKKPNKTKGGLKILG